MQANDLITRMRAGLGDAYDQKWKVITVLIGGNNLCHACSVGEEKENCTPSSKASDGRIARCPDYFIHAEDVSRVLHILPVPCLLPVTAPRVYKRELKAALDILVTIPRALINLVAHTECRLLPFGVCTAAIRPLSLFLFALSPELGTTHHLSCRWEDCNVCQRFVQPVSPLDLPMLDLDRPRRGAKLEGDQFAVR